MTEGLRRSLLYVPAVNARATDKARTLPCDVVILDLEDSVAPEAKDQARQAAVAAIAAGFGQRQVALRCNGLDTPWGAADLQAAAAAALGRADIEIWAMIESCAAVLRLEAIAAARASTPLAALLVGTNDLAAEMRCRLTTGREALAGALSQTVIAARRRSPPA